jgi:hypothetical protein
MSLKYPPYLRLSGVQPLAGIFRRVFNARSSSLPCYLRSLPLSRLLLWYHEDHWVLTLESPNHLDLLAQASAVINPQDASVAKVPWDRRLHWLPYADLAFQLHVPHTLTPYVFTEIGPLGWPQYQLGDKILKYSENGKWEISSKTTDAVGQTSAVTNAWLPLAELSLIPQVPEQNLKVHVDAVGIFSLQGCINRRPAFVGPEGKMLFYDEDELGWVIREVGKKENFLHWNSYAIFPWETMHDFHETVHGAFPWQNRIALIPSCKTISASLCTHSFNAGILGHYVHKGNINDRPLYQQEEAGRLALWFSEEMKQWLITEANRLGETDVCIARAESTAYSPVQIPWLVSDGAGGFTRDDLVVFMKS